MAYRIIYDAVKAPQEEKENYRGLAAGLLVMLLVAGALVVKSAWLPWVQEVLLPGDPAVTAAALEGMVEDLREGQGLVDAVTTFCREIMAHAE